jgi:HEAT repeat protein
LLTRSEELSKDPTAFAVRAKTLKKAIGRLTTISELRRALSLTGWRDEPDYLNKQQALKDSGGFKGTLEMLATVDREARKEVGDRLAKRLEAQVAHGDATSRIAVAKLLAETGASVRSTDTIKVGNSTFADLRGYARQFTPLLVKLTRDPSPAVRQAAARALGRTNSDVTLAAPALKQLLQTGTAADRRAAADGLLNMVSEIAKLFRKGRTQTGVEANIGEVLDVSSAVVPVAGLGVEQRDAVVRRLSLATLEAAATSLSGLIPEPFDPKDVPPRGVPLSPYQRSVVKDKENEIKQNEKMLEPLVGVLTAQGDQLARVLADSDPEARLLALRTLEWIAGSRLRLRRRWESLPELNAKSVTDAGVRARGGLSARGLVLVVAQQGNAGVADLLRRGVTPALDAIAQRLRDPDPVNRRAAVDFLEMLENDAAPAVPALVGALADQDIFVRWAAARTLGRIAPDAGASAVPALARLLQDRDLDVRLTAAATLEAYGLVARSAVPALAAAVTEGDPEFRRAVLYTLMSIGPDAAGEAVPAVASVLTNLDPRVRRTAAETLGRFGAEAASAIPALRRALQDEDQEVRQAASDALLDIAPAPK